ncbi:MAG: recombinase family protein [Clostridiales bacterium]|nr:recombinase family protein [Clostridiales bacterium]
MNNENGTRVWKAAIYLRLSKDDRDKTESNSIKNQRDMLLDFVSRNPDITVAEILADDGFTGANFDRAGFKDMIRLIENGDVDCVLVKDFSRLGRDHIETGKYIERYFATKKVRFIAVNESYDSLKADMTDAGNSLIVPFKNIMNEAMLEDISVKTKSQLETKRRNGELVSNYAVYGYVKKDGRLAADDYAADVVKMIFDCKITGYNEGQIAAMLNARGFLSPAEYKKAMGCSYRTPFCVSEKAEWSPNAVRRILQNRVYLGHLEQGKRTKASYRMKRFHYKPREMWNVCENAHEPIIDELDFDLAQELMAMDTRIAQGSERLHLFSGFVVCGLCGQPMTAKTVTKKSGKAYVNYICTTHKMTGECRNNNVSELKLKSLVLLAIQKQVSGFIASREVAEGFAVATLKGRKKAAIEGMIERNLQAINDNGDYLVKSYRHFADGIISESEYEMFKKSFNSQIQAAEGNINTLRGELERLEDDTNAKRLIERFLEHENISELNRRVVAGLIKSITVNTSRDITVNFRYASGYDISFAGPEPSSERAVV